MFKYIVITSILMLITVYLIADILYMTRKMKVVVGDSYGTVCRKLNYTDENFGPMDDTHNGESTYAGYKNIHWWHPFKVSFRIYFSNTGNNISNEHVVKIKKDIELKWFAR